MFLMKKIFIVMRAVLPRFRGTSTQRNSNSKIKNIKIEIKRNNIIMEEQDAATLFEI